MSLVMTERFWNQFQIPLNKTGFWEFGPLSLWIFKGEKEWKLRYKSSNILSSPIPKMNELYDSKIFTDIALTDKIPLGSDINEKIYYVTDTNSDVSLSPVLPDRNVIVRPVKTIYVVPYESINLYIPLPIWVRVEIFLHRVLDELPLYYLKSSWFGRPDNDGEICYSTQFLPSYNLLRENPSCFQAIICLTIKNQSRKNLRIERIKVPLLSLPFYQNTLGQFYTRPLILIKEKDEELSNVELGDGPIKEMGTIKEIYPARIPLKEGLFSKTINNLF
jgi:hypothetical protein